MKTYLLSIILNAGGTPGVPLGEWATYAIPIFSVVLMVYVLYGIAKGFKEIFKHFK